jgi:hypothetical protein
MAIEAEVPFQAFAVCSDTKVGKRANIEDISQQALALDDNRQVMMQTDVTWWSGTECLAVVDAKYKRLLSTGPRPEDVYQVLAYCPALGMRSGHLVDAAGGPSRLLMVRNAGVHIQRTWSRSPTPRAHPGRRRRSRHGDCRQRLTVSSSGLTNCRRRHADQALTHDPAHTASLLIQET